MRQRTRAALGAAVLTLLVTGCTPEPAPTPSPTGFASEAEAFAAAEATYRAYVDAVNAKNSDGALDPRPTDFLIGDALDGELAADRQFTDLGIRLGGPIDVKSFDLSEVTASTAHGAVCLDVSDARVLDAGGDDVTPPDRDELLGLALTFIWTPDGVLVSESVPSDSSC